jgi:tetratricopeptide (TPR) repeat protein
LDSTKPTDNFVPTDSVTPGNVKVWKQTMLSIDELNKRAAIEGGQPSYHNRLGVLYSQAGDFAAATKQFNLAVDLSRGQILRKNDRSKPINLSSLYVELTCAHSNLAKIYDHLGDHDRAIAELEALNADIAFSNESHLPSIKTQQTTVVLSQVNQNANTNYKYPYNVQLTPEQAALFAKAEALRQVGQIPEAIQSYNDLISQVPNFALAHQRLGMAAAAANNFGLAVNELLTALTLDSKDPDTYNDLGLVYRQLGDFPAAKKAFARGHEIDPTHLALSMNYADSLAKESHFPSALHVMQQAVGYHPDSPAAHNDLGSLYARTGNDKAAAKEFAQTINLNSGLASAHYGLGIAQLNLKSYPQAITELETAQKLNPGILDLQNKLDLANSCNSKEVASASQGTTGVGY